jgi:RHS repeat-associated protein
MRLSPLSSLFYYTARALDTATSLQNNLNRWYDSAIGRWASEDLIEDDINLYRYCTNNPLTLTDPSGLWPSPDCAACVQEGWDQARKPKCDELKPPVCGLEIGPQLDSLAEKAKSTFSKLLSTDPARVIKACSTLNSPVGWEVEAFLTDSKYQFCKDGCGTGKCRGTVQVHGQCYWASEVNYFWYGLANSLCAQANKNGQWSAMSITLMWRYVTWWYGDGTTAGRYSWAYAGANGNTTSVPATASECSQCSKAWTGALAGRIGLPWSTEWSIFVYGNAPAPK